MVVILHIVRKLGLGWFDTCPPKDMEENLSQEINTSDIAGNAETADSRWYWLYKVSAVSATILEVLFLIAAISLIISVLQPDTINGWLMLIQNNWLIVLFKLNARFSGAHLGLLNLNLLDSIIMILAGTMFLGLYTTFRQISKIWTIIALAQPFIGMMLFIITKMAGRLGIMSAMLIISFMMLRSDSFSKITAVMGILAGILLIVGDAFTEVTLSIMNSILIAIGYVLMMTWFFVISRRLFQLGQGISKEEVNRIGGISR